MQLKELVIFSKKKLNIYVYTYILLRSQYTCHCEKIYHLKQPLKK